MKRLSLSPAWLMFLVTGGLAARTFVLVHYYSVNILYWDEWDYYLFLWFHRPHTLWASFDLMYGPMRMGIGLNLMEWIARASSWDIHTLAYIEAAIYVLAAMGMLALKKRLFGALTYFDIFIPVVFLSLSELETLFWVCNLSHGALPVLLLTGYALTLTLKPFRLKWVLLNVLNFLLIFSQAGLFIAPFTLWHLTASVSKSPELQSSRKRWFVLSWSTWLISLAIFFHRYVFVASVDQFHYKITDPGLFLDFFGTLLKDALSRPLIMSGWVFLVPWTCLLAIVGNRAIESIRRNDRWTTANAVSLTFIGFSLLVALFITYGRISLGTRGAITSRYHPYITLMLLGIYFCLCTLPQEKWRKACLSLFVGTFLISALWSDADYRAAIVRISGYKSEWAKCYRETGDIEVCNENTGFQIYPKTDQQFKDKLAFLRANSLNLFKKP